MTKILLTIVLLLALAPGSLSTAQTEAEKAAAKDFQVFWNEFRQAIKDNDKEKIASMSRFPFKTEDLGQNVKKYAKESFLRIWDKLLQCGSGRGPGRETMRQYIDRMPTITSKDFSLELGRVVMGSFVFEKAKGKWLFTMAFIEE